MDYKKKYLKYKEKYLKINGGNNKSNFPKFKELLSPIKDITLINEIETQVLKSGYKLLKLLDYKYNNENKTIQIATSESLTAGLIMSSLVKLPIAGWAKYGCLGVYDTDAKRVFNSVKVSDVYTHLCAKEMAVGLLKNSNATFAISVTGNAMPYYSDLDKLGEVFIGLASYGEKNTIIYSTHSISICLENDNDTFSKKCKDWIKSQPNEKTYAKRSSTATISILIRNYTAYKSMLLAIEFIKNNNIIIPDFIEKRKNINNLNNRNNIPSEKYPNTFKIINVNKKVLN